jgi:hypothetical protein
MLRNNNGTFRDAHALGDRGIDKYNIMDLLWF